MRYILGILIALGLIVLVFVLIIKGLSGGGGTPSKAIDLPSYAGTNAVARLIIDGPVVDSQDHRTVRISVSQAQAWIDIIQGYEGNVINTQSFPNSQAGFAVFLKALQQYGFNKGNNDPNQRDERGFCPLGNRYIYELESGEATVLRYWSTSCGGQGTFGGNAAVVRQLFQRQIPDPTFRQLTGNIPLNG